MNENNESENKDSKFETSSRPSQLATYPDIFDRLTDATFLVNPHTFAILEANPSAEQVLGLTQEQLVGRIILDWVGPLSKSQIEKEFRIAARRYHPRQITTQFQISETKTLMMDVLACTLALGDEKNILQLIARDITFRYEAEIKMKTLLDELTVANQKLELLSNTDALTGLYNFRHFTECINQEHLRVQRSKASYALVYIDIDYFKNYNDQNGHPAGDQLLKELGQILRLSCRKTDIPVRYGGEEFAILCPETNWQQAKVLADRIRTNVEKAPFEYRDRQPNKKLTVSIGVSSFPTDGYTPDDVLKAADRALYFSKQNGRNQITIFCEMKSVSL